jgi:hypothetical protein
MRDTDKVLVAKPEEKRTAGKPVLKLRDNIKMDFRTWCVNID